MTSFMQHWHTATVTSLGFFWMAFWAFALGYLVSSLIQVLVTRQRMQQMMGKDGPASMALGTFFGFISSSCSFSALSTTRALLQKGAGLAPSMAFMLSSTNLVVELGIVIAIFLGWQFVVGEYIGGILLILFAWLYIRVTRPRRLISQAREHLASNATDDADGGQGSWQQKLVSMQGWHEIAQTYVMEWQMVWKDIIIGFTVAGIIAAFVPDSFFQALFPGSGAQAGETGHWELLAQTLAGPLAAFFTFIGSMGNIPLAALLFERGVSFAGVMAFIFSDLVVFPVLRINAGYYGWRMALYILSLLLTGLVLVSLVLHYAFSFLGLLPSGEFSSAPDSRDFFSADYGFYMNLVFIMVTLVLVGLALNKQRGDAHEHGGHHHHHGGTSGPGLMFVIALLAILWLLGGSLVSFMLPA